MRAQACFTPIEAGRRAPGGEVFEGVVVVAAGTCRQRKAIGKRGTPFAGVRQAVACACFAVAVEVAETGVVVRERFERFGLLFDEARDGMAPEGWLGGQTIGG